MIIKPITQAFVVVPTDHLLCDEAIEARQQFLVGTALN